MIVWFYFTMFYNCGKFFVYLFLFFNCHLFYYLVFPTGLQVFLQLFHSPSVQFLLLNNSIEADDTMAASILRRKIPPISTGELCAPSHRQASRSQSPPRTGAEPAERQHLIGEFCQDAFLFFHIPRSEPQCSTGLMSYSEYS